MKDNKVTFVGIGFLLLCLGLAWGVYFLDGELRLLKDQHDELDRRRANLEQDRHRLREQITVFKNAFTALEEFNVRATPNDMDFYAQVQSEVDPFIRRNEVVIVSQRQNGIRDGRTSISMTLRGDYYSFMKILAAWRNLTTTVRVSQLSMSASRNPQTMGEIQADVVVEAIIAR